MDAEFNQSQKEKLKSNELLIEILVRNYKDYVNSLTEEKQLIPSIEILEKIHDIEDKITQICCKNSELCISSQTENLSIDFEEHNFEFSETFDGKKEILVENNIEKLKKLKDVTINSIKDLSMIKFTTNTNEFRIIEKSNYKKFKENSENLKKINKIIKNNNNLSEILGELFGVISEINQILKDLINNLNRRYSSKEIYDLNINDEHEDLLFDENRIIRKDQEYLDKLRILYDRQNYYKNREIDLQNCQKELNSNFEKLQELKYSFEDFLDYFDQYQTLNAKYKLIENRLNSLQNIKEFFLYSNLTVEVLNDNSSDHLLDLTMLQFSNKSQEISQCLLDDLTLVTKLYNYLQKDSLIFEDELDKKLKILSDYLNKYNLKSYFRNLLDE